jgi:hypothetical protein
VGGDLGCANFCSVLRPDLAGSDTTSFKVDCALACGQASEEKATAIAAASGWMRYPIGSP